MLRSAPPADLAELIDFSDADLEANRAGRLTSGQAGAIWVRAAALGAGGLVALGVSLALAFTDDFGARGFGAPLVFLVAAAALLYAAALGADAASGGVASSEGVLNTRAQQTRSGTIYSAVVGEASVKISKGHAAALPTGERCRAYFVPATDRMVSVERSTVPATEPARPYLGPHAVAPMRFRVRVLFVAFALFTLLLAALSAATAHPARPVSHQGVVDHVYEYSSKGGKHWELYVEGDGTTYHLHSPASYDPPLGAIDSLGNQRIEFSVNGRSDVIELTTISDDVAHTTDLYRDPSLELTEGRIEAACLTVAGLLILAISLVARRRPA